MFSWFKFVCMRTLVSAPIVHTLIPLQIFTTSSFPKIPGGSNVLVRWCRDIYNTVPNPFRTVYGIFTLDCVQTLLVTVDMFDNFIYRWGSSTSFSTIGNGWFSFIILGGVISAIVQWSFSWRLWILARSMILTGAISIVCVPFSTIRPFDQTKEFSSLH